jgi:hypothetical protein
VQEELTPQQRFNAESPDTMVPRALRAGKSHEEIIADLERLEWTRGQAQALIARVEDDLRRCQASPESRTALISECRRQMLGGLAITGAGLALTGLSFLAALTGLTAVWIITSGFILGGLVLFSRGYARWSLYRRQEAHPARDNTRRHERS